MNGLHVRTLGCKVNRVESDDLVADLLARGGRIVQADDARVIVVNTCTVTGEADAKARKAVRAALRAEGRPVVVVTGCLAALDVEDLRSLDARVVVEPDKDALRERVAGLLGLSRTGAPVAPVGEAFRTRVAVKIQDGCDAGCAYCIVPRARGRARSAAFADVGARLDRLAEAGVPEVVLTGINLGRYRDSDVGLDRVVRRAAAAGIPRVRLSSIEPLDLTDDLLETLASTSAVCEHLHVPLQSGSDRVLAQMGRAYTTERFAERIAAARSALGDIAVTTDVIAGLPSETDADAERTAAFVEEAEFSRLHVFRYSEREGTAAAARQDQVDPSRRRARADRLRALDAALRRRFEQSRLGSTAEVLVERHVGDGSVLGTTREYLQVRVDAPASPGELLAVRLVPAGDGELAGVPVEGAPGRSPSS